MGYFLKLAKIRVEEISKKLGGGAGDRILAGMIKNI